MKDADIRSKATFAEGGKAATTRGGSPEAGARSRRGSELGSASEHENAISENDVVQNRSDPPESKTETDRLTASDYVVGAAHATQFAGVGGPAVATAAQAIGAADAAGLAQGAAAGRGNPRGGAAAAGGRG